jgi:hypothetical protein
MYYQKNHPRYLVQSVFLTPMGMGMDRLAAVTHNFKETLEGI